MNTTEARIGDWIQTASGKRFYPFDPRPEEIDLRDIAAALSRVCRFGGHCREFYSVAQHSVLVSQACGPDDALWGLLHDASEAYLGDVPRPIKRHPEMEFYRRAEERLQGMILQTFGFACADCWGVPERAPDCRTCAGTGFPGPMPAAVHRADEVLLATEARDLMGNHCRERWSSLADVEPLAARIEPWPARHAEALFLSRFNQLMRELHGIDEDDY